MNVLLIRLRLIGDVVFTTPAIRALRRHLPDVRLTYLVEPEAAPVVLANPHLAAVVVASRPRGPGRLREDFTVAKRLRAEKFDLVIDFHGGPRSAWLAWATGAPRRIGYTVKGRSWMYTQRVDRPRGLRPRHSVVNQWDLLAPLGASFASPPDPHRDPVEMPEDPAASARVARRLADAGVAPGHSLVVIHVSAGNPFRRWPPDSFVEVIAGLARPDGTRRIVLTSGPSDRTAVARITESACEKLGTHRRDAIVRCGEFDLAELRALLARSRLFIGGDSGPLHVAATTTVPIVGLYGPTLPARSAPWRSPDVPVESVDVGELPCRPCDQRRCAPGDFRCLIRLGPQVVVAAAERAMAHASVRLVSRAL